MSQHETTPHEPTAVSQPRAARYVRMSTEHQQYSTENQADKINEYATHRGITIVRTYADEGKSGLRIDGRQALQRLIGVIVFFLQIDTLPQKNSSRDKHLQNRLSETPCAFGAD
jgi:DNA invertase Pin-like site-specific DNA recombinase